MARLNMAMGQAKSVAAPPPTQRSAANERLIQQQLRRTMLYVKLVDLFGGVMILSTVVLVLALAAAIVDAWLVDLGFAGRVAALACMVCLAIAFVAVYVTPLLVRRINPEFAARMIEDSQPSLKNSLINFLTFRHRSRTPAHQIVYQELENQAASDLSELPVESAVDRSKLIVAGYVLAGVMVVCGLYKVLSPKDPFQTFARIIAPFSDIERPSRVEILSIEPGDAEIFRGDTIPIAAEIDGVNGDDVIQLWYCTADGQLVDQSLELQAELPTKQFTAELAPGGSGIQQNIEYHITAGDAVSKSYRITVIDAPTIIVQSVEYEYPDYTRRPVHISEGQGDVRGLEGTEVTIKCRANHPIKHAYLELDPPADTTSNSASASPRPTRKVAMQSSEYEATGKFMLRLHADRKQPLYATYRVRFVSIDDHPNKNTIEHRIEVVPDLPPEIKILTPTRNVIQVPENGEATIEVRAIDPDYGLSQIRLLGIAGESEAFRITLLDDENGYIGQVVPTHRFQPSDHGLSAGMEIRYWAIAEDNRTAPLTGEPEPGATRTRPDYFIQIVEPERSPDATRPSGSPEDPAGDRGADDDARTEEPRSDAADPDSRGTGSTPSNETPSDEPDSAETEHSTSESTAGEETENSTGNQSESQASSQSGTGSTANSGGDSASSRSGDGQQGSTSASSGSASASSDNSGSSAGGGSSSANSSQPGNQGQATSGGQSSSPGKASSGNSSEPLHPGEVFEKVLERVEKNQSDTAGNGSQGRPGSEGGNSTDQNSAPSGQGSESQEAAAPSSQSASSQSAAQQTQQTPSGAGGQAGADGQTESPSSSASQSQSSAGQPSQSNSGGGSQPQQQEQSSGGSGQQQQSSGGSRPQQSQSDGQQSSGQQSAGQQSGGQQSGGQQSGGQQSGGQQSGGQQSGGQQSGAQQSGGQQSGGQQSGGQQSGGQQSGGQQSGGQQNGGGSQQQQQQEQSGGGNSGQQSGGSQSQQQKKSDGSQQGGGQGQSGQKGDGNQSQSGGGSPSAQGQNQDRKKQQGGGGQQQSGGPKSPGQSKNQSSSQGDEQGDQSGGAGSGGGQSSGQAGSDSSGGSTPADQGGQTSDLSGGQDQSNRPGDSQAAGERTGRAGSESGVGSQTRRSATGNQTTAGPATAGERLSSPETGGGGRPSELSTEQMEDEQRPAADEANLNYARKATDLALNYLRDQEEDPEKDLLDELNWTPEELRQFIERWDNLKRNAREDDSKGRQELDEALRSLGLRPRRDKRRGGGAADDRFTDYSDAGQISRPPSQYIEKFNAFLKGTARTED